MCIDLRTAGSRGHFGSQREGRGCSHRSRSPVEHRSSWSDSRNSILFHLIQDSNLLGNTHLAVLIQNNAIAIQSPTGYRLELWHQSLKIILQQHLWDPQCAATPRSAKTRPNLLKLMGAQYHVFSIFGTDTCCFCIQHALELCSISYLCKNRASRHSSSTTTRLGRQCLQGDGDGSGCTWTNRSCAVASYSRMHFHYLKGLGLLQINDELNIHVHSSIQLNPVSVERKLSNHRATNHMCIRSSIHQSADIFR